MTVWCVCKSGAEYDKEWVGKLKRGVARNLTVPHVFRCLSDMDIAGRVPLKHRWPGWWAKLELFRVVDGPSLYLDLDTVVVGNIDHLTNLPYDFAAIRNFHDPEMIGSAVMWLKGPMKHIYDKFCEKPYKWIEYHERKRNGPYLGDQAFIWNAMNRKVDTLDNQRIYSYKFHCKEALPKDAALVCFGGQPKAPEIKTDWMRTHWK